MAASNLKTPTLIDERILKAQSNPIRSRILDILSEGPNSPSGLHRRIEGPSLQLVGYHIQALLDVDLIELVEIKKQPGRFAEHIYRRTDRQFFDAEEWEAVDARLKDPIIGEILRKISNDTGRAAAEGKFSEISDSHLSRSPIEIDPTGWTEVTDALSDALRKVLKAHANSQERAEASGGESLMPARVVIMQFPIGREDRERQSPR